jgi:hypothetical protein
MGARRQTTGRRSVFVDHLFVLVSSRSQEIDGDNPWRGYPRVRLVLCVDSLLNSEGFQRSFGASINLIGNGFFFNGNTSISVGGHFTFGSYW